MSDPKCVAVAYDGISYILQLRHGDGNWDTVLEDQRKHRVIGKGKLIAKFSGQPLMDYTVHGDPEVPLGSDEQ